MTKRRRAGAAELHNTLVRASGLQQQGDLSQAATLYRQVLRAEPRQFDALHLLGVLEGQRGNPAEAAALLGRAVRINPNDAAVHTNYGNALLELRRFDEALASYDRSLRLNPNDVQAHYNRGVALADLQRPDEALEIYRRVAAARPDHAEAWYGIGNTLVALNRPAEALEGFHRAQALHPERADFYLNEAFCRLLVGDYERGWPLYEWRWRTERVMPLRRTFSQPEWKGHEPLDGKTILLHAEQGFGDTLQFCRYASMVARRGGRIVLEAQPALVTLLRTTPGASDVVGRGDALPDFDLHSPLLSLPRAFRTTIDTIPAQVPYLFSEPERVRRWSDKLGPKTKPRVGLVWSGSGGQEFDQRSMHLAEFAEFCRGEIEFVCLQKEVRDADRAALLSRPFLRSVGEELADFADTAALLELLDLVITVDTAVAHLAGALAKPVWVLLAFEPAWRWLLDRTDNPWYQTARLFRQTAIGDWRGPIEGVRRALAERFGSAGRS